MQEGVQARLTDILEAIAGIERVIGGTTFEEYQRDWTLRLATQRAVEIVSEASRHIPRKLKSAYPYPYWRQVAAIGNILRHEYHRVSDRIIWNVLTHHMPRLKPVVERMIKDLG